MIVTVETEYEISSCSTDTDTENETTTTTTSTSASSTSSSYESGDNVSISLTEAESATEEKLIEQRSVNLLPPSSMGKTISYKQRIFQDKGYKSSKARVNKISELKSVRDSEILSLEFSSLSVRYKIYNDDQRKNIENCFRANQNAYHTNHQAHGQRGYFPQNPIFAPERHYPTIFWCPPLSFSTMFPSHPPTMLYILSDDPASAYPASFTFDQWFN